MLWVMQRLTPSWCFGAPENSQRRRMRAFPHVHSHLQRETRLEPLRAATTVAVGAAGRALNRTGGPSPPKR
jgi:hypothetical protein